MRRFPVSARLATVLAVSGVISLGVAPASAHFVLKSPASSRSQDALGDPQKLGPCGDEAGGTATGTVTTFKPGETITVTIDETIFHPGHYRIALSVNDRSELPAEPPVDAGTTACGSAPIASAPKFPVLADGVFLHTTPFKGPQSVQVTLPSDVTCTKCTLQVIQFMSNHGLNNPGGCYYHHCADLAIAGGASPDASTPAGDGGAPAAGGGGSSDSGCACSTPAGRASSVGGLFAVALFAVLLRRRRGR